MEKTAKTEETAKKSRLGRGLEELLGEKAQILPRDSSVVEIKAGTSGEIRIESIETNPNQPRADFEEQALEELAVSIKAYGIITPITVRPVEKGKYQLISGERRLRAAKMAGLTKIPAYVCTVNDTLSLQMALVENIQREDLNAIEIAVSYQRLLDECDLTQEALSEKVGKDRSTIANYLRLLKLSREAQLAIRDKKITMGHARTLVVVDDDELQEKIVKDIISQGLSVRQTESLVKKYTSDYKNEKTKIKITLSNEIMNFQTSLSKKLNAKVAVNKDISGKGKITIPFASDDELKNILLQLDK